jgi:phosphatidylinositol alpha-1,6-mannosyltransferase
LLPRLNWRREGVVHVLALVTDAFGGRGGIARYNRDLLAALAASAAVDRITVLPRLAPDELSMLPHNVEQRTAIFNPIGYSIAALRACGTLRKDSLLFCGHLGMSPLVAAIARLARSPMWLQVHGIEAWTTPSWSVRWAAQQATLITSVSRYTKARMSSWWNGEPSRIRILSNTFGTQFTPGPRPVDLMRRYGLAGRKVILTVSRLVRTERYKGNEQLIAALPEIRRQHADAAYLIVGDGDDIGRLRSLAAQHGVSDHVVFAGHVSDSELPDHFRLADVYVMPSTQEGFGIVFLEAAASGLPVIGGHRDGSVDALADGRIGRAIDPNSREEIVAAVIDAFEGRIIPSPAEVQRFSSRNFAAHVDELVRNFAKPIVAS